MNINFTGIKNVGYLHRNLREAYDDENETVRYLDPDDDSIEKEDYDADIDEHYLTVQLTDDYNGKDLTEFRNVLKRSKIVGNPLNSNDSAIVSFAVTKEYPTDEFESPQTYFYLNECDDPIPMEDKNLGLISFLAKLVTRVSKTENKDFLVNRDYLDSIAATSMIYGENLKAEFGKNYDKEIRIAHSPQIVRDGAKEINKLVQERMFDYFS
ncbi:MAG: hypothetical protein ACI37Q_01760 [Candidatus Gastranaerophilaceae bacterium]